MLRNGDLCQPVGGGRIFIAKCGGLFFPLFFLISFFIFFLPFRFMIAMDDKSRQQKKTATGLIGRRSSALACPSDSFWFFKSLHFVTPNHQELLYQSGA